MTRFLKLIVAFAISTALAPFAVPAGAQQSSASTKETAAAKSAVKPGAEREHRLVIQIDSNEPAAMNLALNNAANVDQYYSDRGEPVEIEIIAFGPGLHMLRADTSPVKDRVKSMADSRPAVQFKACGNTQENMAKVEKKKIPLLAQASVVPSGVVRIMELQEQGWSYIRP